VEFLNRPTRNLFFTGKGGVGKTSLACAAAVDLAARGRRVLLVSTDPASNLDEVFGVALGGAPTPVPEAPGLFALNLDPQRAAREYREQVVGPYRAVLPAAALAAMEEQLSGACTVEIAAFTEFSRLLGNPDATAGFDHVLFDTAPTGHTLRLLSLPSAWNGFIASSTTGTSCLGPLAGLEARRELYEATVAALADPARTTVVLVTRPEPAALREAERSGRELAALGVRSQHLVINGVFAATARDDPVALALEWRGLGALHCLPHFLADLPRTSVPLVGHGLVGVAALRALFGVGAPPATRATRAVPTPAGLSAPPLASLVDDLGRSGRGVILTMGKGGVGKTTVAAAVAVELARRGHCVHLSTTDPAAHVEAAVGAALPELRVSRIDLRAETQRYTEQVLAEAGAGLDAQGRALLAEDLRSPCTEEVAVFRAFAEIVAEGEQGFVVLDTAPTGHTVLLLDGAQAYHREVSRQASRPPEARPRRVGAAARGRHLVSPGRHPGAGAAAVPGQGAGAGPGRRPRRRRAGQRPGGLSGAAPGQRGGAAVAGPGAVVHGRRRGRGPAGQLAAGLAGGTTRPVCLSAGGVTMLRLESVTKSYARRGGAVVALRPTTLEVAAGEFVAVVGPSGSGKSTLLSLMGGMLAPTAGKVWLDGQSLYDLSVSRRARLRGRKVGFVFQTFSLVPYLTALENVQVPLYLAGLAPREQRRRSQTLLERLGLGDRLAHRPAELSVGQQQRVALARTLANDPALVLADEPTGNLDPNTRDLVLTFLEGLRQEGRTVVLVTHDPAVARRAGRALRLAAGEVSAEPAVCLSAPAA
jgi:arsenite-transporting ATPase